MDGARRKTTARTSHPVSLHDSAARRWAYRAGLSAVFMLCAAPVIAAFLPLLQSARESTGDAVALLASERLWGLWAKTCRIALGAAVFATASGAPLGVLLARPTFRDRAWCRVLLSAPLLLPAHVLAVAWIDLLGQQGLVQGAARAVGLSLPLFPLYTPAGVVAIQALAWYPVPMWTIWNALRHLDPALAEAARNLGARRYFLLRTFAPLLMPAVATGALIVFLFSLLSFSVPSLLQVPVFTVEIYTSFNSLLDPQRAVLMALPLMLTGLLAATAALRLHARSTTHTARTASSAPAAPHDLAASGFLMAVLILVAALPVGALFVRALPLANLARTWHTALQELGVSVTMAALGATLMLAIALPLAWNRRGTRLIFWIAALAYLASGPVLGVGLIQLWNRPGLAGFLYDHPSILLLAVTGRYLLFAWLGSRLALRWLPQDALDAARNLGASSSRTLRTVVLPNLRRPLVAVWACLVLLVMGDAECIVLIAPPGWTPVSLRIFTLMHYGPSAMVSALALLQAISTFAILATAGWMVGRGSSGRS